MIGSGLARHLEGKLKELTGKAFSIDHCIPVSGGCINHAYCIASGSQKVFLKYNRRDLFPGMFASEAAGLQLLRESRSVNVPHVLGTGEFGNDSYILLENIEPGKMGKDYWEDAGRRLATLHRCSSEKYGLKQDNYIGTLRQSNKKYKDWIHFFLEERIKPFTDILISPDFEKMEETLRAMIPAEMPALLHGDLWNGNVITGSQGQAFLIDPAVYYGHREMDLAMTKLFGGFPREFYEAYEEEYSLQPGFEERMELHNLYPLLVHARLFGGSYAGQANEILKNMQA
jgi:fructosamine-3-kinase